MSTACPRCNEPREVRFHSKRPLPRAERVPGFTSITGAEERELYGTTVTRVCSACEGKGQVFEVTGDYAADYVTCRSCSGSGNVSRVALPSAVVARPSDTLSR